MKKKLLAILMATAMSMSLIACGGGEEVATEDTTVSLPGPWIEFGKEEIEIGFQIGIGFRCPTFLDNGYVYSINYIEVTEGIPSCSTRRVPWN